MSATMCLVLSTNSNVVSPSKSKKTYGTHDNDDAEANELQCALAIAFCLVHDHKHETKQYSTVKNMSSSSSFPKRLSSCGGRLRCSCGSSPSHAGKHLSCSDADFRLIHLGEAFSPSLKLLVCLSRMPRHRQKLLSHFHLLRIGTLLSSLHRRLRSAPNPAGSARTSCQADIKGLPPSRWAILANSG